MASKAVPNVPFYMSQANQEFLGTPVGNISTSMYGAGVPVPGLVSALGGRASSWEMMLTPGFGAWDVGWSSFEGFGGCSNTAGSPVGNVLSIICGNVGGDYDAVFSISAQGNDATSQMVVQCQGLTLTLYRSPNDAPGDAYQVFAPPGDQKSYDMKNIFVTAANSGQTIPFHIMSAA